MTNFHRSASSAGENSAETVAHGATLCDLRVAILAACPYPDRSQQVDPLLSSHIHAHADINQNVLEMTDRQGQPLAE